MQHVSLHSDEHALRVFQCDADVGLIGNGIPRHSLHLQVSNILLQYTHS